MTIVGFTFTKMLANKNEGIRGKINIANNVSITGINEKELLLSSQDQKGVSFTFLFSSKYEPKVGEVKLEGHVLYLDKKDNAKKIIASWKKDKKIDKEIMKNILNTILTKCNIQALILSKEIGLPPPIPLPKVDDK